MDRLTSELTFEQIDSWFHIGGTPKCEPVKTVPRTTLRGLPFSARGSSSEEARRKNQSTFVLPPQIGPRHNIAQQTEYATKYRQQWEQNMLQDPSEVQDPNIHSSMSDMESVSEAVSQMTLAAGATPPELAVQVYQNYNFDHIYNEELPITSYQEQITNTIDTNQVTIIQGQTGSGKTTQVAQYILDNHVAQNKHCNIVVTQPRRIAAISIARRVCEERRWQIGSIVGYQVGMDRCASDDTRLTYMTTGILLRKLISTRNLNEYTHIILDEVHERDQEMDFALLVVRKLQRTNSRHVRVILMSATFDTSMFAQYFAMNIAGQLVDPPIVNVEGECYDVQEYYVEDFPKFGLHSPKIPKQVLEVPDISSEAYHLARKLILYFDELEEIEQGVDESGFAPDRGTVLVFLPGINEIHSLDELLIGDRTTHRLWVLPLHSTITSQEQRSVFNKPQPSFRKVILSTNIAESSITVADIKYVIDFMLTKCMVSDNETNFMSLKLNWASKANAVQRKGRAGRVSSGKVYRLCSKDFYEFSIDEFGIPEMLRAPLEQLILQVKVLDLGEPKAILALALQPPKLDNIARTILLLKEVGALSTLRGGEVNPHDGDLTFVGKVLASLPVDIRVGKLLCLGYVFGCLKECLIIGAGLSLKSFFARPYRKQLEAYKSKVKWTGNSFSDCLAILNAYLRWEQGRNNGEFRRTAQSERKWGEANMIQINIIREVAEQVQELADRLGRFNIRLPRGNPNRPRRDENYDLFILKMVLAGAFYPNYFTGTPPDEADALRQLVGKDPCTTVMVKNLPPNSHMYYRTIATLFVDCGKGKSVSFEGSKAYIEFERPHNLARTDIGREGSTVLPAVYTAVKMRQLRLPLCLEVYEVDDEEIQKVEEAREALQRPEGRDKPGSLKSIRFEAPVSSGKQVDPPRAGEDWIDIMVTEVVDGNRFYAHYANPQTMSLLTDLMKDIETDQSFRQYPLGSKPVEGQYCLAPYKDQSEEVMYYRARIETTSEKNREHVEVFYLDYGNVEIVPISCLYEMPKKYLDIPFQAFECVLCGIKSYLRIPGKRQWTPQAKQMLARIAQTNKAMSAKVFSIVGGVVRVELYDIDCDPTMHINEYLVYKGIAERAEEPYVSKVNHQQRQVQSSNQLPNQFVDLGLLELPNSTVPDRAQVRNRRRGKVHLHGPYNPYEMGFFSMTRIGRIKTTSVEHDSINSVALHSEPEDRHQRLMVAAHMRVNHTGNVLIARDTTIMPNIPDLPALTSMIFTPAMELRTDPKKERLTGALCGLGLNPDTLEPMLPDHDIEVTFDTKITADDIAKINGVRQAINIAIGSDESWGPLGINNIQKEVRQKLLDLMLKKREPVDPKDFNRPYIWDMVDPEDILHHDLRDKAKEFPMLYEYHNCVAVTEGCSSALDNIKEKQAHIEGLYARATRSTVPFERSAVCRLCDVVCYVPLDLLNHLNEDVHKREEIKLEVAKNDYLRSQAMYY